ncbi:MAG: TVP38/TMEM64 family protein [Sulfuricaulis sp.]|uniref:TVP38/TMEM64 family protein n=1 Tax=Sulfuricaulis sp. TaxID=2003553 RepID=UPI003C536397
MNRRTLVRIVLFAALAAAIALAYIYRDLLNVAALESAVKNAGTLGPLLYMAVYAIATVLFLPGSVITLAGGALFGPVWGTLYSLTGATLGATVAFLIARYLASDWVHRKTGGWTKQLIEGVEKEGWRFVAFVRLVPLFPFNLLNYALGLTRIGLVAYVVASYVFMFPGALAYTYLGYVGREAVAGSEGLIQKGLLALALLSLVAFLPSLIKRLRGTRTEK